MSELSGDMLSLEIYTYTRRRLPRGWSRATLISNDPFRKSIWYRLLHCYLLSSLSSDTLLLSWRQALFRVSYLVSYPFQ